MFYFQVLISSLSGPVGMFIICSLVMFFLYVKNYKKDFYKIFFTSTVAMTITFLLKYLVQANRPLGALVPEFGYSFPSAHATMAAVVMSLIIHYSGSYLKHKAVRYGVYILAVAWYVLVAYSRIYLQVHYPIDVIAGGMIGIIITVLMIKIFKHFHYYNN